MTTEQKDWIDNASTEALLEKWRFTQLGDPMFEGDTGTYYSKALAKKRDEDPPTYTAASKNIMRGA